MGPWRCLKMQCGGKCACWSPEVPLANTTASLLGAQGPKARNRGRRGKNDQRRREGTDQRVKLVMEIKHWESVRKRYIKRKPNCFNQLPPKRRTMGKRTSKKKKEKKENIQVRHKIIVCMYVYIYICSFCATLSESFVVFVKIYWSTLKHIHKHTLYTRIRTGTLKDEVDIYGNTK